jgi:hypothetical protein
VCLRFGLYYNTTDCISTKVKLPPTTHATGGLLIVPDPFWKVTVSSFKVYFPSAQDTTGVTESGL